MYKTWFRHLSIVLLAFLLVVGNFSFVSAFGHNLSEKGLDTSKPAVDTENLAETDDPDKDVRVIVEMEEEAPIQIATFSGKKYEDLDKSERQSLEQQAKTKQLEVKDDMEKENIKAKHIQEFTTVVNGFSTEMKQGDIDKVQKLDHVKKVHVVNEYERPAIEPEMKYSKELVEAQKAWRDYGYKGEGMVVGIIDTGIDPGHQDMVLTDNDTGELTEESVDDMIEEEDLPGQFYSEKVPYGYNYMDENDEIRDVNSAASMHGMHVAGTVGANGDEDDGGILGIAPETQLLALKVFGNDPEMQSTYGDVYIKAIDDSIKLGVDVLNMSLGSPAGFVDEDSPEQQAVERAVDNGVLMSISGGNSALFADGFYYPLASNPDYGVSGSPGVSYESLQVASFENTFIEVDSLDYSMGEETGSAAYLSAGNTEPSDYVQTSFELVDAGLGGEEEFAEVDAKGKYALVQRGEHDFITKSLNAQAAGALGVIIYNNTDGIINMATDDAIEIPQLFMLKGDGDKLSEALQAGEEVAIEFGDDTTTIDNPDAGKMSDFSSWGLTPNLDFKPEITAPGGQILSTLNDDEYGIMSGTSMAAPHVAGGGALVLERVADEFERQDADRVLLAKNLLMNTSERVELDDAFVSPRRQGSGLMQLHAALSTPVVVTEKDTNEAKVALKEITENEVTFELTAENFSDEPVTYEVAANAQTDSPVFTGEEYVVAPNEFGAMDLEGMAVTTVNGKATDKVDIPAGESVSMTVKVDVSAIDQVLNQYFDNGYWLEGFVTLTDPSDTNPVLNVPYTGFKGEWDAAPILDEPMWDEETYYGMTGIGTDIGEDEDGNASYGFLGEDLNTGAIDPEKIAFSPNDDGVQDDALLIISFLRNAKQATFNVLDEDKNVVRTLSDEENVRKNYYDGGTAPAYSLSSGRAWDGKIDGEIAPEGKYYLQVEAVIDFDGATSQSIELPIILDTTAPELTGEFDEDEQKVSIEASDELSGLAYWDVLVDGESVLDEPYTNGETEHQLVKRLGTESTLSVVAVDYAGNSVEEVVASAEDTTAPDLHLITPEFLGVETERAVTFSGYVTDKSGVKEVTIDGEKAELNYNEAEDRYDFTFVMDYEEDGYYFHHIKAVDEAGNETEIGRRFFLDSEQADLSVEYDGGATVTTDAAEVEVNIQDNFDDINLYVNGNHVYSNELSSPYGMYGFDETITLDLDLEDGENTFEFEVVDLGGNVTTEEIVLEKSDQPSAGKGNQGNGPPAHAGQQGPPAHAGQQGPPAHANN